LSQTSEARPRAKESLWIGSCGVFIGADYADF